MAVIFLALTSPQAGFWPIVALMLSAGLGVASFLPLFGRNLLRTPLPIWGMVIAHFGLAVSVAGMAAESGWTTEKLYALRPGETVSVASWSVKLEDVAPVVGDNWVAIEGRLSAKRGGFFALEAIFFRFRRSGCRFPNRSCRYASGRCRIANRCSCL